jgi:hypothetical protein
LIGYELLQFAFEFTQLARSARTSMEMVEKFYISNLAAEMNIDLLQGRRD